jgi:hypothetical protein
MAKAEEIVQKYVGRLWNSSSCPAKEILRDAVNDAIEAAKLACLDGLCHRVPCPHETCDALYVAANRIDELKSVQS